MGDQIILTQHITVAANASGRLTFAPPYSAVARRWYVDTVDLLPNETSAVHATDYADITVKRGSTALSAARSTNSSTGSALTQDDPSNIPLTGTPAQREITQADPLHILFDATPGSGVALDLSALVVFKELRV